MKIEILITADVIEPEDETDLEELKREVKDSIRKSVSKFAGSHENWVSDTLENVDHEVAFVDDEGIYDYFSKKYNPETYNELKKDKYGGD